MGTPLDDAWGDDPPKKATALDEAWGEEEAPKSRFDQALIKPLPAGTTQVGQTPPLATPGPDVVYDPYEGEESPTTQENVWRRNMAASLKEDARRVGKAVSAIPGALSAVWDAQASVGNFIAGKDNEETWSLDPKWSAPYTHPDSAAYQIDSFFARPLLEQLQVLGHGIAPQNVPPVHTPAPVPQDRPVEALSALKDAAFHYPVKGIQAAQEHVGKPVVDAVLGPLEKDPRIAKSAIGANSILLARQAGQFLGGEGAGPDPDADYSKTAVDSGWSLPAMIVGEVARNLPFILFNTGYGAKMVQAEKQAVLRTANLTAPAETAAALRPIIAKEAVHEAKAQALLQTAFTPGMDVVVGPTAFTILGAIGGHAAAEGQAQREVIKASLPKLTPKRPVNALGQKTGEVVSKTPNLDAQLKKRFSALMPSQTWEAFVKDIDEYAKALKVSAAPEWRQQVATVHQPETIRYFDQKSFDGGEYVTPKTLTPAYSSVYEITMDIASGKTKSHGLVKRQPTVKGVIHGPQHGKFEPAYATVARNEEGVLVGREVEAELGTTKRKIDADSHSDAQVEVDSPQITLRFRDTPIRTPKDAIKWHERTSRLDRGTGPSSADNWKEFHTLAASDAENAAAFNRGSERYGTEDYMPPEELVNHPALRAHYEAKAKAAAAEIKAKEQKARAKKIAAMTPEEYRAERQLRTHDTNKLRREDAPLARPSAPKPAMVVHFNENGKLKATSVGDVPAAAPETWKLVPGDLVKDATGTAYIVKGSDRIGTTLVHKIGNRGGRQRVPTASLTFVSDAEGHAAGAFDVPNKPPPSGLEVAMGQPKRYSYDPVILDQLDDAIDDLHVVTVPRLSKRLGVDYGTAAQLVEDLAAQGKLTKSTVPWVYTSKPKPPSIRDVSDALARKKHGLRYEPWGDLPIAYHEPSGAGPRSQQGAVGTYSRASGPPKYPDLILPGMDEPVMNGMEVWFGNASSGKPRKGILRGPDPKRPGNYLLDIWSPKLLDRLEDIDALASLKLEDGTVVKGLGQKDLRQFSIPGKSLRTTIPVNLGKPALQKLFAIKGLYGMTVPHPPEFLVSSKTFAKQVNEAVKVAQANRIPEGLKGAWERAQGQLLNAYYLTPKSLRNRGALLYSSWPTARDSMLRVAERVKDATGGYSTPADQDLLEALEASQLIGESGTSASHDKFKDWVLKNPKAVESMKVIRDLVNERKANSQWLADRGVAHIDWLEQARGAGEEAEYLTMMYNVDVLRGKYDQWIKKNSPALWDAAVKELTRGGRNFSEVENELADIMRQKDPVAGLAKSSLVDGQAFAKLQQRGKWQDKYPAIARLMGPVTSGALRLGHSIGYQRAIIANLKAWDAIQESGWWSPGSRADLTLPIPNEPRFGKAAGGYTHKSLANFVSKEPHENAKDWARWMGFMGGKWKSFNTVYGGPVPWVNNVLRNLKGVAISGGFQHPDDTEGFKQAAGMLLGWRENPSMLGPFSLVGEAKQFGALSSGFAGAEIHDAKMRIQDELLRSMARAAGQGDGYGDVIMAAQEFMRTKSENVKDAYDSIDQWFKLGSYLNLRKRYMADGLSVHDAAAKASEDINSAFPNFELTAPIVERNRGKFGWVAPFLSSKAEDLRINAMTAARLVRTGKLYAQKAAYELAEPGIIPTPDMTMADPGLALRIAAFGAAGAGTLGLMRAMARSNGITAEMEEDGKNLMTMRRQGWSPFVVPMWDLDDKGRMQFLDLTPIEDVGMMFRGSPRDNVFMRMLLNNFKDVVGDESFTGRGVHQLMNAGGLVSTMPENPVSVPFGEGGAMSLLETYAQMGGVPQASRRLLNTLEKGDDDPSNPTNEPWTPLQIGARAVGLPFMGPVGEGTYISSLKEAKGEVRQLRGQAKQIPRRLGEPMDMDRYNFMLDAKLRGLGASQDRINQVRVPETQSPQSPKKGTK